VLVLSRIRFCLERLASELAVHYQGPESAERRRVNKAFCKDADSSLPPRCPRCSRDGLQVSPETLRSHVLPEAVESLSEPAYWCSSDRCSIAYFDLFERTIDNQHAHDLYWPKDSTAPLCSCHGLTCDDIDSDLAEGVPTRVRAAVHKAGQPDAACATMSADGRSCVGRIQRAYLRRRAELSG